MAQEVFWRSKTLDQMTSIEWESLCDGCALCCLHKIEDEDTQEVFYTTVVCHLMDDSCRCTQYEKRTELVPSCVKLRPEDVEAFHWLPPTCAYRLIYEGQPLPEWHPLISGKENSVIDAGASVLHIYSVKDNEISEDDLIDYVLDE
ncbi:YcgN family cysteine cluster protein [Neptunomonas concharum]|uniref:YcgN family cysteine cluster protein n=1 Tax=Neptunomonas concharum TaxID=1031538 RepID=A0A5P1R9C4_9GAMM|nr:YcgN family cysteine cluster protein [Neptunomonas concharum]QEQ96193.1 YcgN family cysteine cluster protein [Neptunomonas concharum]